MYSQKVLKTYIKSEIYCIRCKHKNTHWSVLRKKIHPIDKALEHFDDFYKQVFAKKWPLIRQGLLGKQKYVAIVNNYSDAEQTMAKLESRGGINMRTLFNLEKQYIKEKLDKNQRHQYLEKIWKMDRDSDVTVPPEEEKKPKELDYSKLSLESSLRDAEYDASRFIQSKAGLSASNLFEFIPATKIKGADDNWVPESQHYSYYDKATTVPVTIEKEYDISFPPHLNVYCFEKFSTNTFAAPTKGSTNVYDYYLLDGGSVLPVLALNLVPGCRVLDMCAAPGGKSLMALQTLYPECIVSNDSTKGRTDRLYTVFEEYLYDLNERWLDTDRIRITLMDGRGILEDNFNRILVDVPCTTDRHSLKENENNIFRPSRIKERLKLPELQCELLYHALKLVSIGGIVVYSTCSLSPIQNDGVVYMALKKLWEETTIEVVVKDLSPALAQVRDVYEISDHSLMKYGHLVLPCLSQNYGPTYFCKIQRIK